MKDSVGLFVFGLINNTRLFGRLWPGFRLRCSLFMCYRTLHQLLSREYDYRQNDCFHTSRNYREEMTTKRRLYSKCVFVPILCLDFFD